MMADENSKKQLHGIFRLLIKIILYISIRIIFFPFAIIRLIIGMYKENRNCRKLDVSYWRN